jgi:hypothetical protein
VNIIESPLAYLRLMSLTWSFTITTHSATQHNPPPLDLYAMESGNHIALAAASPNAMPNPVGDRGTSIVSVQIAMIVIPTLAVMLRFTARRMSAAGLWWDDWMILVALVCANVHEYRCGDPDDSIGPFIGNQFHKYLR